MTFVAQKSATGCWRLIKVGKIKNTFNLAAML